MIRGRGWEIVEAGEDDLGELSFRLIKYESAPAAVLDGDANAVRSECLRRPGRPSRRDEIVSAFAAVVEAGMIDPSEPLDPRLPGGAATDHRQRRAVIGARRQNPARTLAPIFDARRRTGQM